MKQTVENNKLDLIFLYMKEINFGKLILEIFCCSLNFKSAKYKYEMFKIMEGNSFKDSLYHLLM